MARFSPFCEPSQFPSRGRSRAARLLRYPPLDIEDNERSPFSFLMRMVFCQGFLGFCLRARFARANTQYSANIQRQQPILDYKSVSPDFRC
jgi:hypothetical protein